MTDNRIGTARTFRIFGAEQMPDNGDIAMNSSSNRSIPELFSDAVGQLAKLIGNEFELARAELSDKASQAGRAAAMIGAGAVILIPALVILLFAISSALIRAGLSDPIAYLITGAGAVVRSEERRV